MSINLKRAFSSTANLVAVSVLLLVALVSLTFAINPSLVDRGRNLAQAGTTNPVIYDGGSTPFTCLDQNGSIVAGAGDGVNKSAILIRTTQWAGAMMRFLDSCGGPRDFSQYSRIEFHIKDASNSPAPLDIYLRSYIAPGQSDPATLPVSSAWQTLSVSMADLNNAWDLKNVQEINFKANNHSYYIDSVVLKTADQTSTPTTITTTPPPEPVTSGGTLAPVTTLLYNGDTKALVSFENATELATGGYNGSKGLRLNIGPNNTSVLRVLARNKEFFNATTLQFRVKTDASATPATQMYLFTYEAPTALSSTGRLAGRAITLSTYTSGGVIDGTWRVVSIPLADLKVSGWDLSSVDDIYFKNSNSIVLYVDDMSLAGGSTPSAPGVTAPVISGISYTAPSTTGTTISWMTDKASDTQVEYGLTGPSANAPGYGSQTTLNTTQVTSHSATLSGLSSNTIYHYRVKSSAAGIGSASTDQTFTTASAPVVVVDTIPPSVPTALRGTVVSTTQVNLAWTASSDASGISRYNILRNGVAVGTSVSPTYSDSGLTPATTYSYAVSATDGANLTSGPSTPAVSVTTQSAVISTYTLTVSKTGTGSGTVTSSGGSINCGTSCTASGLTSGQVVTLTAVAAAGSTFGGWSGGGCSGTGACTTTVTAATNITASFTSTVTGSTVTATISSNKTGVMYGESATLTWRSTNATGCTATNGADDRRDGWAGTKAISGTATVTPSIHTGYSITCSGPGGTSPTATVVVMHVDAAPATDVTYLGLSAVAQKSPAQITLSWYPDVWAQGSASYTIYRSTVIGGPSGGAGSWTQIGSGTGIASYVDTGVSVGTAYEYRVNRTNTQHNGDSYIYSGIELPQVTNRGKIILVVDSRFTTSLASQISRLKDDLVGDGWTVLDHSVSSTATPDSVKTIIKADYTADPTNVKAVFLLGHIPVLRSGSLNPDGHAYRSMPADGFYGDMDGTWSPSTSYIPSDIDLEVGRVDMYNMPSFAPLTETDLLVRYLDKDHNFRTKAFNSAVYTNPKAAAMTSDTNKSFQRQFFGPVAATNIESISLTNLYSPTFWDAVQNNNYYLWFSRGAGGGSPTGATGIGYSSDFAKSTGYNVVFNSMFASYFEEWDVQDNFLRAPLAAQGYALTNAWSDNPAWVFMHMGTGKEVGFSTKVSQNNNGYYNIPGYPGLPNSVRGVHMALMGDPTLRMHVVAPVTNLTRTNGTNASTLTWNASADAGLGYNVYKSTNGKAGPFTLVTSAPISGTTYTDTVGGAQYTYMVRAVKLQITPSGSYVNQSQGVFAPASI